MKCTSKIVVFDLDETLGYYTEFGMLWDAIIDIKNNYPKLNISLDQTFFNKLLDLYPEFMRPNMINILNYLKEKKQQNHCQKLMLYTNNQGPKEWAHHIVKYFETKVNHKIFDQIICAFKVGGKQVEMCRTTHMKTHKDFIRCTKIPEDTQICYLDDVLYPGMKHDNIYYINVKPYVHDLSFQEVAERLSRSGLIVDAPTTMKDEIVRHLKTYNYTYVGKDRVEYEVDKILSKKILHHLRVFFDKKPKLILTRRNVQRKNRTLKLR
jgi:hypothetical protein